VSKLRRTKPEDRLTAALAAAQAGSWEARLTSSLAEASGAVDRVDSASEAVSDLATLYGSRSRWSAAALRIVMAVGILTAAVGYARGAQLEALAALVTAVVGAGFSFALGEAAGAKERAQREVADDIVRLLVPEGEAAPKRPRRAW
jgi:hypothetical protein